MDWNAVIEKNREALKRVLASLVAMASLAIGDRQSGTGKGQSESGLLSPTADCRLPIAATLPRHLHRAVLRLLRPAESAARRLIIVAARDIDLPPLGPARPRKPKPKPVAPVLRSLGLAVFLSPADAARAAPSARCPRAVRKLSLPLTDPLRAPRRGRPRYVPAHAAPRILSFDGSRPHRLPPPPSSEDPIDSTRINLRLQALASALDDLPEHARRYARWRIRRSAGRFRRISPLRPGRPPGLGAANRLRPVHEVHGVLADLQYFAVSALEAPDTS